MANRRQDVLPPVGVNQSPPIKYGWRKNHKKAVLPVFGKRSVDSHLAEEVEEDEEEENDASNERFDEDAHLERLIDHEEEKHFSRHHRKTRHDLLGKIEVYLNS